MAKNNNTDNIENFVRKLNGQIEQMNTKTQMTAIGNFLIDKIRVRTRIGNGVANHLDEKAKLKPLSPEYIDYRIKLSKGNFKERKKALKNPRPKLWDKRIARRSALTLTGSMLDSLQIKGVGSNSIKIGPTGSDRLGVSNSSKTKWQEDAGRIYLRLSFQEVKQVRIFWLRQFSDLLKNK